MPRVDDHAAADVAIAPMLREFIAMEEIEALRLRHAHFSNFTSIALLR